MWVNVYYQWCYVCYVYTLYKKITSMTHCCNVCIDCHILCSYSYRVSLNCCSDFFLIWHPMEAYIFTKFGVISTKCKWFMRDNAKLLTINFFVRNIDQLVNNYMIYCDKNLLYSIISWIVLFIQFHSNLCHV